MKSKFRTAIVCVLVIILSACATTPKVSLQPDLKQSIHSIALIETPEPSRYFVTPPQAPGGQALYMFGAIGGAILGGIETQRIESASTRFTQAAIPLNPDLSNTMLALLEKGLEDKGYDVLRIPPPPKTPDGEGYDLTKVDGKFDAILATTLSGGYSTYKNKLTPEVVVSIKMYSNASKEMIFADSYLYSPRNYGENIHIEPSSIYPMSEDELYTHIPTAVENLRKGIEAIANRVLVDL